MTSIEKTQIIKVGQLLVILSLFGVITSPPVANFFIALAVAWSLLHQHTRTKLKEFLSSTIGFSFLTFLLAICIAPLYSELTTSEVILEVWGWRKILMFPVAAIYFSDDYNSRAHFLKFFLYGCIFFSLISFCNIVFFHSHGIFLRNYVTQGLVFSIGASICLVKIIDSTKYKTRIIFAVILLILIINVVTISTGRSGYVALIIMMTLPIVLYTSATWPNKLITCSIVGILLCSTLLLAPQSKKRLHLAYTEAIAGINEAQSTSVGLRITFLKNTLSMIQDNPILGVGTGGFKKAYQKKVQNQFGPSGVITGDPHNQYLKILIEQGTVGLCAFLWLIITVFNKSNCKEDTQIIGICTLTAWCATSLANAHFSTFNEGQFIWIFTGILLTTRSIDS